MKAYKIGICGNFDVEHVEANGQTIKTINVYNELVKVYGEENIKKLDTYYFRTNPIKAVFAYLKLVKECEHCVILPAEGAVKVLVPLGVIQKKRYKTKIYYPVIGAWLGKMLKEKKSLLRYAKSIDWVLPETETLKKELLEVGLERVEVLLNFKDIPVLSEEEINISVEKPLKLCYFARVNEMKGIGELIEAVKNVNREQVKFTLDIYGPVKDIYSETFRGLMENFPEYIKYCGVADGDKSVETLKGYFMQVFPTKYATEGIPGSLVDSLCAGVPVLSARWNSCHDILDEGSTGISFELCNFKEMEEKLEQIAENPEQIIAMRVNCIKKALNYKPEEAIRVLTDRIEEGQ